MSEVGKIESLTSLRDQMAMAALTGIIACFRDHNNCETVETRCLKSYEYADEMLKIRKK